MPTALAPCTHLVEQEGGLGLERGCSPDHRWGLEDMLQRNVRQRSALQAHHHANTGRPRAAARTPSDANSRSI